MTIIHLNRNTYTNYFPSNKEIDSKKLMITNISKYSSDNTEIIKKYMEIISKYIKINTQTIITDGTSNIGGAVINFAQFMKVNAVERDIDTCNVLKNNIKVYNLEKQIKVYCESYVEVMMKLKQDIIYLDPPWGGANYKKQKLLKLFLDKENINNIINKILNKCKLILLKVPKNFDLNSFIKNINLYSLGIVKIHSKERYLFNLIVIKT